MGHSFPKTCAKSGRPPPRGELHPLLRHGNTPPSPSRADRVPCAEGREPLRVREYANRPPKAKEFATRAKPQTPGKIAFIHNGTAMKRRTSLNCHASAEKGAGRSATG